MCLFDLYTWLFILKEVKSIPVFSWFPRSLQVLVLISFSLLTVLLSHLIQSSIHTCLVKLSAKLLTPYIQRSTFKNQHTDTLRRLPDEPPVHAYQCAPNHPVVPVPGRLRLQSPRLKICEPLTVSKIVYPATFGNIVFWFFLILLRLKCFDNYPCICHLSFNTFYYLWVKRFDFLLVDCTYQFFFHSPSLDVAYCSWLFVVLVTCLFFLFLVFLPPHLGISSLLSLIIYLRPPTLLRTSVNITLLPVLALPEYLNRFVFY